MERRHGSTRSSSHAKSSSQSRPIFAFTLGSSNGNGNGVSPPREQASIQSTVRRPSTSAGIGNRSNSIDTVSANSSRKGSLPSAGRTSNNNTPSLPRLSSERHRGTREGQSLPRRPSARQFSEGSNNFEGARVAAEAISFAPDSRDPITSTGTYSNMLARPATGYQMAGPPGLGMPILGPTQPGSPTLEAITYQHIQEMASKRISTLDYLRKAHEGRVYWFNTLFFSKSDLQRMPYFDSRKLARRATNYLLLGVSLPTILDLNASTATEFLKSLNALLQEFDSFQQIHPAEGSSSSLSRARIPQMFKRATTTGSKGRRTSSAAEIGLPGGSDTYDGSSIMSGTSGTIFSAGDIDLLPGEEYTHLLTPSLPFDPDFYETFATLCDVLIDCYTKLMTLASSPRECGHQVAEMFTKADARVRKIIIHGVVKEFEDSSRAGVKSEVAGVGRVVLGGLM